MDKEQLKNPGKDLTYIQRVRLFMAEKLRYRVSLNIFSTTRIPSYMDVLV